MSELSASKADMPSNQMILRGDRRPRVMAQSASFGEEAGPGLMVQAGIIVGAGVVVLALWGGFIEIDDAVSAKGEIIPAGDIQSLRHTDGGMVGEILVREGETVKKGQVLLRLKADEAKARLLSLQNKKARTELMAAGLRALSQDGEPDYSFISVAYRPLVDQEPSQEPHEVADLDPWPLPVLDREGVERQALHAHLRALGRDLAHGVDALLVPEDAPQSPLLRPATPDLHDGR